MTTIQEKTKVVLLGEGNPTWITSKVEHTEDEIERTCYRLASRAMRQTGQIKSSKWWYHLQKKETGHRLSQDCYLKIRMNFFLYT